MKTYKQMKNGFMKKETEGLITAAQDHALQTPLKKVRIEKQGCAECANGISYTQ